MDMGPGGWGGGLAVGIHSSVTSQGPTATLDYSSSAAVPAAAWRGGRGRTTVSKTASLPCLWASHECAPLASGQLASGCRRSSGWETPPGCLEPKSRSRWLLLHRPDWAQSGTASQRRAGGLFHPHAHPAQPGSPGCLLACVARQLTGVLSFFFRCPCLSHGAGSETVKHCGGRSSKSARCTTHTRH